MVRRRCVTYSERLGLPPPLLEREVRTLSLDDNALLMLLPYQMNWAMKVPYVIRVMPSWQTGRSILKQVHSPSSETSCRFQAASSGMDPFTHSPIHSIQPGAGQISGQRASVPSCVDSQSIRLPVTFSRLHRPLRPHRPLTFVFISAHPST